VPNLRLSPTAALWGGSPCLSQAAAVRAHLWSIELPLREARAPAYGYEATREEAMQAFMKAWSLKKD
jgi:hypothetical protein